jgi:hypothetical protein
MARPPEPMFLQRQSYRWRRLGDAAKMLPILGLVLVLLPVLWAGTARTAGGIIYLFTVWAFLIGVAAVLSRRLGRAEPGQDSPAEDVPGGR